MKTTGATEFKRRCSAVIAEIRRTGEPVTVLRRGKPLVHIQPFASSDDRFARYALGDQGEVTGDIIESASSG